MHPIEGGSHLLTIGRDGGPNGTNGDMALQIFDVSNATEPRLVAKQVVANAYSEAEYDHKAFTFYKGMLAVPAVSWNSGSGFQTSTLELFDIDVNNGFTHRGSVNHTALFQNMEPNYCYWYGYGVRRGVFVEDYVYSISEGGVVVNQLDDMNTPVAVLELPHSEPGQYCYY
jgi:uncharacterized secreted protein with C-terminal beta-propeller domain